MPTFFLYKLKLVLKIFFPKIVTSNWKFLHLVLSSLFCFCCNVNLEFPWGSPCYKDGSCYTLFIIRRFQIAVTVAVTVGECRVVSGEWYITTVLSVYIPCPWPCALSILSHNLTCVYYIHPITLNDTMVRDTVLSLFYHHVRSLIHSSPSILISCHTAVGHLVHSHLLPNFLTLSLTTPRQTQTCLTNSKQFHK